MCVGLSAKVVKINVVLQLLMRAVLNVRFLPS